MFRPFCRWSSLLCASGASLALALGAPASAQILQYATYNLLLPLVSDTGTFQSSVYIHNDSTTTTGVVPIFTGAVGSATPGRTFCPNVNLAPNAVLQTSLPALCPALAAGSNYGTLDFYAGAPIAAYARIQSFSGHGFSVDGMYLLGYPNTGYSRSVLGLVRQAAAPTYQSNCFLANREARDGRFVVTLQQADGSLVASTLLDVANLATIRYLNFFAAMGAPAGDYTNVRATVQTITPLAGGNPVQFEFYCTVQNNSFFDADFRYGKFLP